MRSCRLERGGRLRLGVASLLAVAAIAVTGLAAPAQAAPRDNLLNARLCLRGGWTTLQTSTGRSFRHVVWCLAYALNGGRFGTPEPPATVPPAPVPVPEPEPVPLPEPPPGDGGL